MDPTALILLVLIASGDGSEPATKAMTETAAEALAGRAVVVARDAGEDPVSDATAQRLARGLNADAVVVVGWSRPGREHAWVHMSIGGEAGWVDRELAFRREDPGIERGRMLGFEIASMVHAPAPTTPAPFPPSAPAAPAPGPSPAAPPTARSVQRVSIDVAAIGAAGLGGEGGGLGGEASARFWTSDAVAIRGGAGLRVADSSALHATLTTVRLAAGMATKLAEPARWSAGVRVDLLGLRHAASSTLNDSRGSRWLAGADAAVEGAYRITPRAHLVGAVGVELGFGTTRLLLGDAHVGEIPPFRAVVEIGARVSF